MWALIALILFGLIACSFAADVVAGLNDEPETVIVPYDPKKPVKDQHPDSVYLKYDRFLQLWEAAKKNRAPETARPAVAAFAIGTARYEGRVEEKRAAFTVTMEFSTFDEKWVRVPVPFEHVQISELAVDGKPAAFADNTLVVENPGRHTLTAAFEIPLKPGVRQFAWGVPRSAATRLVLTLPETRWTAVVGPDGGVIERIVDGKKTVTAALGTTAVISVALVEAEGALRLVEPATADVETAVTVLPGYERFDVVAHFAFAGEHQDRFTMSLEKGITLAELDAPGMKSWKLTDADGKQTLEVLLAQPAKDNFLLTLVAERPQADALPADRSVPQFSPGARRVNRTTTLHAGDGIALAPAPGAGLRQMDVKRKAVIEAKPVGAWAGDAALGYRTSLAEAKHEARVDYVYQVNRRKIELIASLQLHAKDAPLFDVTLTVPANFEVQAVDSVRLQDWWRDGTKLHVRFKGGTPPVTPLVVYLVREYAAAPQQLDVQPLALDGFSKVTGEAVIAAHKGVNAVLQLAGDAAFDAAKEVDPAKAATDFQILPPLERKRGFAFPNQKFSGQVTLTPLPVKQNATWMMHAEAHEAWLSLSMKAQLTLRQGSVDRTSFSLPAALPEAHVTGAEVRETRSRVEGARRIYEVAFQNDVYDTVDFTVDVDLMMAEGKKPDGRKVNEITLPAPEFPEALITTGYVIADNASEYELKLETEGTEKALPSVIPWLPSVTKSAGIFRVQPQWKVALVLERLEKAESRTAFCAWAEMTTALREDGTEWHKAVWHLQNRSLQFLPVKLPDGATLMSARVAGQNVRADAGKVNGRDAILIPLIKTRPGDISFDVEVVWRQAGAKLAARDKRNFHDAELIGITVEQTFWSVWLPDDRTLTKSDGNMAEVIAVAREVEKARSTVEELMTLNSIIADSNVSEETRSNAKRNWAGKFSEVQQQLTMNGGTLNAVQEDLASNKNTYKGATAVKDGALVQKLADSNKYVGEQLAKVAAENRDIEQRRSGQQQGAPGNAQQAATVDVNGLVQNTASNTNAAQALLFGNNTYSGAANINAGTLNVGNTANVAGGNLAVQNPPGITSQGNVTAGNKIITNGTMQQGALNLNNSSQTLTGQNLRWNANPNANTVQPTPPNAPPDGKPADTSNFYLNDNVVLQQTKTGKGTPTLDKSGSGTLTLNGGKGNAPGKVMQQSDDLSARDRGDMTKSPEAKKDSAAPMKNEKEADMNKDESRQLRYARGNRAQQFEQSQVMQNADVQQLAKQPAAQQPQMERPAPQPMPEAKPPGMMPPPTTVAPGAGPQPTLPPAKPGEPAAAVPPMPDGAAAMNAEQKAIQKLGRLSLSVDFPTQGHVHHFQKAKANAVLEVSFRDPKIGKRWMRIGIFAGLALLLALAGRFVSARRAA
ncbi:MAG: hypothetical protein NTV08_00725 [Verrucomicrobia bacterium]|nr:hypothetical protein [Verrucomicrobiota bacterium]